jgi:hypothetical protein
VTEDLTKIPELEDADISEMHIVAMHAWQSGCRLVTADPAHIVALADEVLTLRKAIRELSAGFPVTL